MRFKTGEILARIPEPDTAVKTAAAVIRRQAKQMTRLIDDLLDVARITQGRIQLQKFAVDIADSWRKLLKLVSRSSRQSSTA